MLTGDDGLPLARPPAGYPLAFPDDGILVDDPGHPRDLTAAVRAVFDTVFGASADAVWQEAAALLDPKGHDLRTWLARDFFDHHLARHSKSRRKAPILWQLGPASAGYSIWSTPTGSPATACSPSARDVVAPKLALEERRQTSLVQEAGPNPTAKQRAEIAAQDAVVAELRVFADEVRRVAPLWNPDLDDGIVLVEAPLWRLVPAQALAEGAQEPLGRPRRRQVRLGAPRDAPLARAGRAQVRHRPQPRHRPRARGRLLGRGCRRQVDQARQAHPAGRGARRRAHLARGQGRPRGPARGTGTGSRRPGPGEEGGVKTVFLRAR